MQSRVWMGVVVLMASGVLLAGVGAAAEEGPLADAGLDQTVPQGTSVYLDGGGSVAPEGSIATYEWTITAPNGTTVTPGCISCEQTEFTPTQVGTYEAQLTVTDEAGRTDTDTLYVEVEAHEPPEVRVSGPDSVDVDEQATVTLTAAPGDSPLSSYSWRVGGNSHSQGFFDNETEQETTVRFDELGITRVEATVADLLGAQATDSTAILVRSERPYVTVTLTDVDRAVTVGSDLGVTARVHNVGYEGVTQDIRLQTADGRVLALAEDVWLGANESRSVSLSWSTAASDIGRHDIEVASANESDGARVRVEPVSEEAYFEVAIDDVSYSLPQTPDAGGQTGGSGESDGSATAQVVVRNLGAKQATQDIVLDGEVGGVTQSAVDSVSVELDSGDSQRVELTWYGYSDPGGDTLAVVARSDDTSDRVEFYDGDTGDGPDFENIPDDSVVVDPLDQDSGYSTVDGSESVIVIEGGDGGCDPDEMNVDGPGTIDARDGVGCELQLSEDATNGDTIEVGHGDEVGEIVVGPTDDDEEGWDG